jgi:hypothetical protein
MDFPNGLPPEVLMSEAELISEVNVTQSWQEQHKRGRKKIAWTFAEGVVVVRLYLLTRLDIKNISQTVSFAKSVALHLS